MVSYLGLAMGRLLGRGPQVAFAPPALGESRGPWVLGLGCVVCGQEEAWIEVVQEAEGSHQVTICGHFTVQVPMASLCAGLSAVWPLEVAQEHVPTL